MFRDFSIGDFAFSSVFFFVLSVLHVVCFMYVKGLLRMCRCVRV